MFVVSEAVVKTSRPWVRICLCMWLLGAVTSTPVHVGNGTHFSFLLPIAYVARSRRKTAQIRDVCSCAVTGGREELRACVHVGFASNFSIFLFVEAWRGCWFHGNVSQLWKLPRPVWGAGWVHNFRNLHPTHVCAGFLAVLPPKNGFCGSAAGVVIIRHMRVALEAAPSVCMSEPNAEPLKAWHQCARVLFSPVSVFRSRMGAAAAMCSVPFICHATPCCRVLFLPVQLWNLSGLNIECVINVFCRKAQKHFINTHIVIYKHL